MLTGENVLPDYEFDWTITPHADGAQFADFADICGNEVTNRCGFLRRKTEFCAFLYANPHCAPRNEFLEIWRASARGFAGPFDAQCERRAHGLAALSRRLDGRGGGGAARLQICCEF